MAETDNASCYIKTNYYNSVTILALTLVLLRNGTQTIAK